MVVGGAIGGSGWRRLGVDSPAWVLVDGGEGLSDMSEFLRKMLLVAELVGLSDEGVGYRLQDGWVVVGAVVKIAVGVGRLPVDLVRWKSAGSSLD